ncbi:MAG: hypothetical protein JJU25_12740, partial [Halomonas sp.]
MESPAGSRAINDIDYQAQVILIRKVPSAQGDAGQRYVAYSATLSSDEPMAGWRADVGSAIHSSG